jgi:hypothetical protein
MLLKQVICTLVGTHPTPLFNRLSRFETGNPFPLTWPDMSLVTIMTTSVLIIGGILL